MEWPEPAPNMMDVSSTAIAEVIRFAMKCLNEDLTRAAEGDTGERMAYGYVASLRLLIETFPNLQFYVNRADLERWRSRYVEWHEEHGKTIRLKRAERDQLLANVTAQFDRLLELCLRYY